MYSRQDIPGKGKGLVASQRILRGTLIFTEQRPTTIASSDNHRPNPNSNKILAWGVLPDLPCTDPAASQQLASVLANFMPSNKKDKVGLVPQHCFVNHSCHNNAHRYWNDNIKRHTIHAIRNIEPGEEITIAYVDSLLGRIGRQQALKKDYDFSCTCKLCSLSPEEVRKSDARLLQIRITEGLTRGRDILSIPEEVLGCILQLVYLLSEKETTKSLAGTYFDAAQVHLVHGDLARASSFFKRALDEHIVYRGDNYPEIAEHKALMDDPRKSKFPISSAKWKTTMDEVPQGLTETDFDRWLWKRAQPPSGGTLPAMPQLPDTSLTRWDFMGLLQCIGEFSIVKDGKRTCHGCGTKGASLLKCTSCTYFWYCNAVSLKS